MEARKIIVQSLAATLKSQDPTTRTAAAMAMAFYLSKNPALRIQAPKDELGGVVRAIAPLFAIGWTADVVGRHMAGHGATTISNTADGGGTAAINTGAGNLTANTTQISAGANSAISNGPGDIDYRYQSDDVSNSHNVTDSYNDNSSTSTSQ
jgi:hypothetical protein